MCYNTSKKERVDMTRQVTVSLMQDEAGKLEEMVKLSGRSAEEIMRMALNEYHEKLMSDEDRKELERINAFLDVQ